ncbi:hypothetical protein CMI47_10975 [Candidatus Pacearchaeota archaeon]|nr:hypothetical protein [Candidatus Pacearchaeota archaeon]
METGLLGRAVSFYMHSGPAAQSEPLNGIIQAVYVRGDGLKFLIEKDGDLYEIDRKDIIKLASTKPKVAVELREEDKPPYLDMK